MAKSVLREWVVPLIVALVLTFFLRTYIGEARSIPSSSMEPTLQIGDVFWLEKISTRFGTIEHSDIIVFWPPEHVLAEHPYIKRVIAGSGDTVEIVDGLVYVNGTAIEEPYARPAQDNLSLMTVPQKHVFVLGDNRLFSADSRSWGVVSLDRVIGKAVGIVWPAGRWQSLR